jgi:hypothetical protein
MNDAQRFRACIHGEPGPAGHCPRCGAQLVHNRPSRLDRAKAALEAACARYDSADAERTAARQAHAVAILELDAAEKEAARLSIAAIPPLLLEMAREVSAVVTRLAKFHGIPPETLRAALEAGE